MNHSNAVPNSQDPAVTAYSGEPMRRVLQDVDDPWIAASMRLCALALDMGLVTAPELQAQIDACRTRAEVTPFLRTLAAGVILKGGN